MLILPVVVKLTERTSPLPTTESVWICREAVSSSKEMFKPRSVTPIHSKNRELK